jgi:hypothetical protein
VKKATLAVAFLFLAACSKQETKIPTPADLGNQRTESGPRATFIRNLDLGTALSGVVPVGICAQLVQHESGEYKGLKVIEVSSGPTCPSEVVDDSQTLVEVFKYEFYGESNGIKIMAGSKEVGLAEWYSMADKNAGEARKVQQLCTGSYASVCSFSTNEMEGLGGILIH